MAIQKSFLERSKKKTYHKMIPTSVISEGMGHDNEETTRIYLAAIQTNQIDDANRRILKEL